jgi:glycosyltransferase involved in cell wall biosynthesis
MFTNRAPLVSVAIPLFKSRQFLDCILENIEAIRYPNVEIIVSDRHGADDTLELLEERFKDDARCKFIRGSDRLNWVEHHNALLRAASGKYFCWMAHDDSFPSSYLPQLVSCLEENPDVILAFGRIEPTNLEGQPLADYFSPPPVRLQGRSASRVAVRLLTCWNLGLAFRGLFRRELFAESGWYIRPSYENVLADVYWVFGLALKGRLCFVPSCFCQKRYYKASVSGQWQSSVREILESFSVLRSYIEDFSSSRRAAFYARAVVGYWTLLRLYDIWAKRVRAPAPANKLFGKLLRGVMRPFI